MNNKNSLGLTRSQKIINSIIDADLNVLNTDDLTSNNDNYSMECPVSPLESGAQYAVEDLSFNLFNNSEIQQLELTEDVQTISKMGHNEPAITPVPSPAISFTVSSPTHSIFEREHCINSDFSTSTPGPIQNKHNIICESPQESYNPSSDVQSVLSASETPVYSSGEIFSPNSLRNRKRKYTKKKDVGRLRETFQKEWVDMKRKRLKNLGLEYNSRDGKVRRAKSLGSLKCNNKCNLKCSEMFPDSERQKIFDKYWAIGDHSKQWVILAKYIKKINKRRTVIDHESRRYFTYIYYLPILNNANIELNSNTDCTQQRVCKTTFLQTFSVSEKVVRTALQKYHSELASHDQRGHHNNHPNTITDGTIESITDHVKLFKPVESHYCRRDTNKVYLDESLSFRRMYTMYNEWFDPSKYSSKCNSLRQYRDIVNKKINLGFHKPKKDLCDICHIFKNEAEPDDVMKLEYATHIRNKNLARSLKAEDKQQARLNNDRVFCACYDMQKILYCPHGDVSLFYYKMKLKLYNFTVFDTYKSQGYCYLWTEQCGKKGPNEIASFVYDLIRSKSIEEYRDFRFWSDNCASQNRNRIVFFMYLYASKKCNVNIKHTFLEKGHTQSEVDSIHATIEKAAKSKIIYTPAEWNALIKWSKQTGEAYNVTEVSQNMILNFKYMQNSSMFNWKKATNGDQVKWSKIKCIMVDCNTPDSLKLKYDLDEDAPEYTIDIIKPNKTRITRLSKLIEEPSPSLKKCYDGPLPITEEKKKDLLSMCKNKVIPISYHTFFSNLVSSVDNIEDASPTE